jgi:hypothetical protein
VLYTVFFPDISDTSNASATNVFVASNSITAITQWIFMPRELRQEARLLICIQDVCHSTLSHDNEYLSQNFSGFLSP